MNQTQTDCLVIGRWHSLRAAALPLRTAVFVVEQGVPIELEHDEFDQDAWHALVTQADGRAIATGRLLPDGRVGRLAVVADRRSCGVGKRVLQALMDKAADAGIKRLYLHARVEAAGFYQSFGFAARGDVFEEAGSPHLEMVRE